MAAVAIVSSEVNEVEPSYEEAHSKSNWPKWKEAINVELQNLNKAKTWEVVKRPEGVNVVGLKWVFKNDAEGKVLKWKACLVARGFTQVYGVDYFKTFALVARLAFIYFILAIAVQNDWDILMFDFYSAYFTGILDKNKVIYMEQLPHHKELD
jgi:Reverse transcriptase (RNA-dependent DNA polymerase)